MISSIHPWVARSQLKLCLLPYEFIYPSKYFVRSGPIEIEREMVWIVERIMDDRKKNKPHQFLVHWNRHPEHEAT
jgi:hypothetical protein